LKAQRKRRAVFGIQHGFQVAEAFTAVVTGKGFE